MHIRLVVPIRIRHPSPTQRTIAKGTQGGTGEMIFEGKVGLQIVEGQIERRDASM
jgi:hypothetical protein